MIMYTTNKKWGEIKRSIQPYGKQETINKILKANMWKNKLISKPKLHKNRNKKHETKTRKFALKKVQKYKRIIII